MSKRYSHSLMIFPLLSILSLSPSSLIGHQPAQYRSFASIDQDDVRYEDVDELLKMKSELEQKISKAKSESKDLKAEDLKKSVDALRKEVSDFQAMTEIFREKQLLKGSVEASFDKSIAEYLVVQNELGVILVEKEKAAAAVAVTEEPKKEDPKIEAPATPVVVTKEEPKKEEAKKDEPVKVEITKEEPKKDEQVKVEVTKEEPKKDEPVKVEVTKEDPKKDEPVKVEATKEEPKKSDVATKEDEKKPVHCDSDEKNKVLSTQVEELMKQNQQVMQTMMGLSQMMISMHQQQQRQPLYSSFGYMNSPYQYQPPFAAGAMGYFPQGYQPGQPNIFATPQQYAPIAQPISQAPAAPQQPPYSPWGPVAPQYQLDPRFTPMPLVPGTFGDLSFNFSQAPEAQPLVYI
ncbi:MAG TPA: hypothetical protein VNJ01_17780 [Bacteriovoracaceae bacterium]|nr:hypothetical protein [Bacteriovoracaceae bacterium]